MKKIILFLIALSILIACKKEHNTNKNINWTEVNKKLEDVNKYLVQEDRDRIEAYIKRHNWNMTETKAGFWYEIYQHGKGDSVKTGDLVSLKYEIEGLDGTHYYSSDSLGLLQFKVGMGGVISGLEHGILLLRQGDKVRFIFPPFLAYGLLGDDKKIPPRTILVYKIEVLSLSKKKKNDNL